MEENKPVEDGTKPKSNNDSFWKMFIRKYLPEFLEQFMPKLHKKVDYKGDIEFLESELEKLFPNESTEGRITNDRLIKLPLFGKKKKTALFVHVEIQSRYDPWFAQKMWHFFYRIYDLINGHSHIGKKSPITAIAVYTGSRIPKKFKSHGDECEGGRYFYEFNTYIAKGKDVKKLEASKNIFSILILASIYKMETEDDDDERLLLKEKLSKLAIKKGIGPEQIADLLLFIHHVVTLPPKLDRIYVDNMNETVKNNKKMIESAPIEFMMNRMSELTYGETVTERIEKAEAIAQQAEAEKQHAEAIAQQAEAEKQQAELNYIRAFFEAGFSIQKIADLTKLSVEEVEKLQQKLK